jgi:hypothetical protein
MTTLCCKICAADVIKITQAIEAARDEAHQKNKQGGGEMKFEYQFEKHAPKITMELSPQEGLSEVVQEFEYFLKACGYHFDGHLDLVDDENTEQPDREACEHLKPINYKCDKCLGDAYAEDAKEVEE